MVPGCVEVSVFRQALKKVPEGLGYALLLFVATRAALMLIGLISHDAFGGRDLSEFPRWFDMWNVWDSNWYIDIAKNGYSTATNSVNMANYAFFPLYPMAMRLAAALIGDYFAAGLAISNVCLIIACVYLYKLVRLDDDERTARRAIKYLFLFPTAFIFSGVFTESTFLALSLACFYYARRGRWHYSGVLGFLTALTRPYGVIIALPMAYEYLRSKDFKLGDVRPDALLLSLPLIGLSLFCLYNYCLTGDPLAFMHIQSAWGGRLSNPAVELLGRLASHSGDVRFEALFTLASLALLAACFKKIDISYLAYGLLLILIPLSTPNSTWSMARYILVVFPVFIILAKIGENRDLDQAMTIVLAMFQGLLMALWTIWSYYII
ncbi:putative integral membrane protein [Methanocella conradii HZ254]|uniref:Integral membrane protein n=1 Tax=Methanocella conradii (strain DSM 24694 / JCM 17849 / CGMCC 1.5162 / HZ254) TaxID=1041930 RepID=H8I6S9_METCZ|nr:mannosyltransferase family protein [Methanocella conradii]AFC99399.1 putative integral membrane protein [Methanocella conradii HZ254]